MLMKPIFTMRSALQRLYSMFPNGLPGAGLLLLRLVCGAFITANGVTRIVAEPHIQTVVLQSVALVAALLLLVGFWTPIAGCLIVIVELWLGFTRTNGIESSALLATLAAALAVLGPGAHSVDARRYGRKRIEIGNRFNIMQGREQVKLKGETPMISKLEIERLSVTSSKPFDQVVATLNAAIGHPQLAEFWEAARNAGSMAELETIVQRSVGGAGLMLFAEFDHGAVVRKGTGRDTPRIIRFVIGNPLIMKEMAKHVPDAGSYAPVTVLVDERPDGVHLSYDRMASLLVPYGNPDALEVARNLDTKVEDLLRQAAG
jgi:uncharacterized protein (DUF302 family)/uncharacterized membrane protein YphA (DoxX/SURF4 family)